MPFKSEAQARWAFATKQKFAKDWADMTDFKKLPQRAKEHKTKVIRHMVKMKRKNQKVNKFAEMLGGK